MSRFEIWRLALARQDTLFLNLFLIVVAFASVWFLHLRKNPLRQWLTWSIIYVTYWTTLVLCYINNRT